VTTSTSGADTHRAAAAALDIVSEAVTAELLARKRLDDAVKAALGTPGVTQVHIATVLGMTARGLRKRLATRQETS